jgi:hypothetical protein
VSRFKLRQPGPCLHVYMSLQEWGCAVLQCLPINYIHVFMGSVLPEASSDTPVNIPRCLELLNMDADKALEWVAGLQ